MMQVLLTTKEVAAKLRVTPRTVQNLIRRGELPIVKVASATLIPTDRLVDFILTNESRRGVVTRG